MKVRFLKKVINGSVGINQRMVGRKYKQRITKAKRGVGNNKVNTEIHLVK